MRLAAHINVGDIVSYLHARHQIVIDGWEMRSRFDTEKETCMPGQKSAMQMIGNLCSQRTDEHGMKFNFRTVGSKNDLFDI